MAKRVIALFPPPSLLEPIAELRQRFDPSAGFRAHASGCGRMVGTKRLRPGVN
jgi:hypothetical protein